MNTAIQEAQVGTMTNPMVVGSMLEKGGEGPKKRNRITAETQNAPRFPSLEGSVGNPHDGYDEGEHAKAKEIGIRIREVRSEAGESMEEFGKKLGLSGAAVYKWEAGLSNIRESNLKAICFLYNVSLDWMLGKDMPKIPESQEHMQRREMINHAMMFLDDKELMKTEFFITDILEKPLHIGVMRENNEEVRA